MDIHLQSFTSPSLVIAMSKPAYLAIVEYFPIKPVIIYRRAGTAWSLPVASYMVIIMGVQYYYEGKEHRYAVMDVLQMMGRA
jgi:replicative superfamily II helicase